MPTLYVIAGCNGAGKTTASYALLPEILQEIEFVNADEIARGISPFHPEGVAFQAGRVMLTRIRTLLAKRVSFALETTLSTKIYRNLLTDAQEQGYTVVILFLWLNSITLAKDRVKNRVQKGGHDIPDPVITRRYFRGLENFFNLYQPIAHYWMVYDNSTLQPRLVAEGNFSEAKNVPLKQIWEKIKQQIR